MIPGEAHENEKKNNEKNKRRSLNYPQIYIVTHTKIAVKYESFTYERITIEWVKVTTIIIYFFHKCNNKI